MNELRVLDLINAAINLPEPLDANVQNAILHGVKCARVAAAVDALSADPNTVEGVYGIVETFASANLNETQATKFTDAVLLLIKDNDPETEAKVEELFTSLLEALAGGRKLTADFLGQA